MSVSPSAKLTNENILQLPDVNFKRVLVPVDFSASTLETLRYAAALAQKFGAVVDVLHVIHPSLNRNEETSSHSGLIRTMSEGVRLELKRLVGMLRMGEGGDKFAVRIREGRPCDVILSEARSSNAALIVMGTRTRSWLSGLIRRHTVKQIIQHSPCPVMVLRSDLRGSRVNRFPTAVLQVF
jgi:nucleotide-binding universal stress UspA family protein